MSFSVGDRVDIWFWGDAKRNGVIIKETPTRFLVEFWNGEPKPRQVWRKKDEVYDCLVGVQSQVQYPASPK